jgi:hypothetical protein
LDTGAREENRLFLEHADRIVAVVTPNEIILDELHKNPSMKGIYDYFSNSKAIHVVNKLYEGWDAGRVTARYRSRYSMDTVFALNYDGDVLNSCCTDRRFYSFLIKELKREKNEYAKQIAHICSFLTEELCMEKDIRDSIKYRKFRSLLRSSLF